MNREAIQQRRIVNVYVSAELLASILSPGRLEGMVVSGLPADGEAQLIDVRYEWNNNRVSLWFSHPSFNVVEEGQILPTVDIQVRRTRDPIPEASVN